MNKISVNIKQFILTGKFGCINIGMTREQIIKLIGTPDWYGIGDDESCMTCDMWIYGNIELYFNYNIPGKDKLGMLFIKNLNNIDGGNIFEFDYWFFKQEEDNEIEFDTILMNFNNKDYKIVLEYDDQKSVIFSSGVTIGFNTNDEKKDGKFYSSVIYLHYNDLVQHENTK